MINSSEGLTPTLRPALGVGWNRPLPAPFAFEGGWFPDGNNDAFDVPNFSAQKTNGLTFEAWVNPDGTAQGSAGLIFAIGDSNVPDSLFGFIRTSNNNIGIRMDNGVANAPLALANNVLSHLVICLNLSPTGQRHTYYVNGNLSFDNATPSAVGQAAVEWNVAMMRLTSYAALRGWRASEYRVYNRVLRPDEVRVNYNAGLGNNPCVTENLLLWLKFKEAEAPESLFPGGVPANWPVGVWGVRDHSGHNHHVSQFGMSNDATLGGKLQPFVF